ncbi:MAG: DUF2914 domain-containing protein [Bdellovibrionota bacterium]
MLEELQEKLHPYKKYEHYIFFVCGFAFDALLLHRIDDPLMLIHQGIYLTLAALLIAWDIFHEEGRFHVTPRLNKFWNYREGILHFLLGTLLNVYTIFYFKSGSFIGSIYFLALLALLLFLNEARPKQISKHFLRNMLFGLCLISYMNILVSIAVGSIGTLVFLLAIAIAYLIHSAYMRFLRSRLEGRKLFRDIHAPFLCIAAIYMILYFAKVLPPVPLSVKYIGIYHEVQKEKDEYKLAYTRSKWFFWQNGDQSFYAKPGDKIICFAKIFSPARFQGKLQVRWSFKDPKLGWQAWDAIPLEVSGGREEGFRAYTVKSNYQAGEWRAAVETEDGREVGRIGFEVIDVDPSYTSETHYDFH